MCCGSVQHIVVVKPVYGEASGAVSRDSYADFDLLSNVEKTSYVLGSEHWEKNFKSLLFLVKEYIADV